jgi:signal transduction histidine kinase
MNQLFRKLAMRNLVKGFPLAQPAIWGGVVFALMVGAGFYYATLKSIENDSRQRFLNMSRAAQNTIVARIKTYTDVLRSSASLFQSSQRISGIDFTRYVSGLGLDVNYPAIESLNFAYYVRDEERPAFEQRLREEQARDPNRPPPFSISPPGRRHEYLVITYIEPKRAWRGAHGFDITADPLRQRAAAQMRDMGTLQTSGEATRAASGRNRMGLSMRMPAFRASMPTGTVDERRAAYIGSVGVSFSVPKLVQGVLADMPIKNPRMRLIDTGIAARDQLSQKPSEERLLFDSFGTERDPSPPPQTDNGHFSNTLPVNFNGRVWKAVFSAEKTSLYTDFDENYPKLAGVAGFVGSLAIYALFYTLTSSRRRAISIAEEMTKELRDSEARLQTSHDNLQRLAAHADHIKEDERRRIAREIHDELGQNLLALRIEADMLASRTEGQHSRLNERARWTLSQIDRTIKSVRQIINDLRPNVLDLGLGAAVEWQIAEFVRRTGLRCELIGERDDIKLSDSAATALFRILQESLANIERHAKATQVNVTLQVNATRISMAVTDNGIGFEAGGRTKSGSFGLVGIEERIRILGGAFTVTSIPGRGTTVSVSVALEQIDNPEIVPAVPGADQESHEFA